MAAIALWICIIITFGFALLQFLLTFGVPLGEYVLGGRHKVLSNKMRLVSITFSCIFVFVGLVFLQRGNIIDIGLNFLSVKIAIIIYIIFLGYAIFGNLFLTKSKKEKYVMSPLSIIAFISSIIVLVLR